MAVCARPEAPPMPAPPVPEVVRTPVCRRPSPIGDLVPCEASRAEPLLGGQVPIRGHVVVGVWNLTPMYAGREPGPRFHDQGVRRDVVHACGDHGVKSRREVFRLLAWCTVDQI